MKEPRTFDCVAMKDEIQARLLRERAGMADAEVDALVQERLRTSKSPVARLWRRLTAAQGEGTGEP